MESIKKDESLKDTEPTCDHGAQSTIRCGVLHAEARSVNFHWTESLDICNTDESRESARFSRINEIQGLLPRSGLMNSACWIIIIQKLLERIAFYCTFDTLTSYAIGYVGVEYMGRMYSLMWIILYISPIISGIITDNNFNRFAVSLCSGTVYLVGFMVLVLTTMTDKHGGVFLATLAWTIGCGAMRTPFTALGADQIPLDGLRPMHTFFSWYYLTYAFGRLMSKITSVTRNAVICKVDTCHIWIFTGGTILFLISLFILAMSGSKYYRFPSDKGIWGRMLSLTKYAIPRWIEKRKEEKYKVRKRHTLFDYGDNEYSTVFINDVNTIWDAFQFCILCSIYWAVRFQVSNMWKLQSKQMLNIVKSKKDLIDQLEKDWTVESVGDSVGDFILNGITCILILLMNYVFYPIVARMNIFTCYKSRMSFGIFWLILYCIYGGVLQIFVEKNLKSPKLSPDVSRVHFLNVGPCLINITSEHRNKSHTISVDFGKISNESMVFATPGNVSFMLRSQCDDNLFQRPIYLFLMSKRNLTIGIATLPKKQPYFVMAPPTQERTLHFDSSTIRILTLSEMQPRLDSLWISDSNNQTVYSAKSEELTADIFQTEYLNFKSGNYHLNLNDNKFGLTTKDIQVEGQTIETWTLQLNTRANESEISISRFIELSFERMTRLHHLPMYVLFSLSDVTFSVAFIAYVYAKAPDTVKAMVHGFVEVSILLGGFIALISIFVHRKILERFRSTENYGFMINAVIACALFVVFVIITIQTRQRHKLIEKAANARPKVPVMGTP